MKIFQRTSTEKNSRGNRLNIIDENNVLVGYDFDTHCCEKLEYYFSVAEPDEDGVQYKIIEDSFDHEGYVFDPTYFSEYWSEPDDGHRDRRAVFKLVKPNKPTVYLTLRNYQNGYYSHGFEMFRGTVKIKEGEL